MKMRPTLAILVLALAFLSSRPGVSQQDPGSFNPAQLEILDWRFAFHFHESVRLARSGLSMTLTKQFNEEAVERFTLAFVPVQDVPPGAISERPDERTHFYRIRAEDLQGFEPWRSAANRDIAKNGSVTFTMYFNAAEVCLSRPLPPGVMAFGISVRTARSPEFKRYPDGMTPEAIAQMNTLFGSALKPCESDRTPQRT